MSEPTHPIEPSVPTGPRTTSGHRPRALLLMSPHLASPLFSAEARALLRGAYDVDLDSPAAESLADIATSELTDVEVLVTGWGAAPLDEATLDRLPRLRAVLHTGGATDLVSSSAWHRGITVVGSADENAVPVAEYAAAMILLSIRHVFRSQQEYRRTRAFIDREQAYSTAGARGARVGLVGASRTGRRVAQLLRPTDLRLSFYDPYLAPEAAQALGAEKADLDDLLTTSDVVSLHAPLTPATEGMIGAHELSLMRDGTTLVNSARGGLVDHAALERELVDGRLWAVLDTTDPLEPLPAGSPLWDLPNVVLTPHVAGSMGNELGRLGDHVVEQALRLARGLPLAGVVPPPTA